MHLSLPKQFTLLILASSICWSLQGLISALTQGVRWCSRFFRHACSVMLWGRRKTANKYHWHVFTVIQPPWVCPHSRCVCFPSLHCSDSRLLCWELSDAGPGLHALPRSKPLRFRFSGYSTKAQTWLGLCFAPVPGPSSSGDQILSVRSHPPVEGCYLSPPPFQALSFLGVQRAHLLKCAICHFWEADLWQQPSWWM